MLGSGQSAFVASLMPLWRASLQARSSFTLNARLDEITPKLIERYKEHGTKQGVGLVTVQHGLRALRRALRLAVDVFEYKFTPPKIKLRKEPQRDYVVSEGDFQRLLEKCGRPAEQVAPTVKVKGGSGRETMQALMTVLYDCGLRAGEAVKLTWDRVNLEERWLFVDAGKTKAARRRIPLTSRVVTALEGLKAKKAKDVPYVFTRHGGKQPLTVGLVSHEFGRIRKLLGLADGCVLHGLRHSFATRLGNKRMQHGRP
jgi:integrase